MGWWWAGRGTRGRIPSTHNSTFLSTWPCQRPRSPYRKCSNTDITTPFPPHSCLTPFTLTTCPICPPASLQPPSLGRDTSAGVSGRIVLSRGGPSHALTLHLWPVRNAMRHGTYRTLYSHGNALMELLSTLQKSILSLILWWFYDGSILVWLYMCIYEPRLDCAVVGLQKDNIKNQKRYIHKHTCVCACMYLHRYCLYNKIMMTFLLVRKVAKFCLIIHQSNNTKFYSLSFLSLAVSVQVCLLSLNVLPSRTRSMIRLIYCWFVYSFNLSVHYLDSYVDIWVI